MLFRKKPKTDKPMQDSPGYISNLLSAGHRKAADYLNRKTAGWSPLKLKVTLILFCLLTGNICLYMMGKAILSATGPPKTYKVQRLNIPTPLKSTSRIDSIPKKSVPP